MTRPRVEEEPEIAEAYARGRAEERARVVAWLRSEASRFRAHHVRDADDAEMYADDIERGEHAKS